ncbi:MAG: hypothetical protein QM756_03860 [Polyangiaceae bacterium]
MNRAWLGVWLCGALACSSTTSSSPGQGGSAAMSGGAPSSGGATSQGGAATQTGGASQSAGTAGATSAVTWSEHVAPIVFAECVGCHRDGGIAPFSLTTYVAAQPLAESMAQMVKGRWMPPMPVDNSGACNTYSNARWLDDAEIALIDAWYHAGAPEGDPNKLPQLPAAPTGLENPSAVLDPGADYTPNSTLFDDYRCFVLDSPVTNNAFLVAYEVVPGDAREVHHAIVYQPSSEAEASKAVALDAAEAGLGYTCFGGAGVDADPRALWAPGATVTRLPEGTGLNLVAGRKLILQVHYNLTSGAFPDRTRVRLATTSTVAAAANYLAIADTKMSVAPGQLEGTTTRTLNGTGGPLKNLRRATAHAHARSQAARRRGNRQRKHLPRQRRPLGLSLAKRLVVHHTVGSVAVQQRHHQLHLRHA